MRPKLVSLKRAKLGVCGAIVPGKPGRFFFNECARRTTRKVFENLSNRVSPWHFAVHARLPVSAKGPGPKPVLCVKLQGQVAQPRAKGVTGPSADDVDLGVWAFA